MRLPPPGLALLLFPAVAAAQPRARGAAPIPAERAAIVARIDSLARAFVSTGQSPAISVAVLQGRDTLLLRGYGLADVERQTPASAASVYQIGSITKQFTAALVMRLVERGALSLDDPIGRHVAGLPAAWAAVPIRQLLNHTSGIPSYTNAGPRWMQRLAEPMTPDTIVALTARDTMDFAPGTRWSYDNTGYVLLGMLVERRYGRPYAELVRRELTAPVGLASIRYCDDADTTAATTARGYARDASGVRRAAYIHMSQPFAAGALCAAAGDIARWNGLLAAGRVVRPASYRAMTTPEGAARTAPSRYGFGLAVDTLGGHGLVTHGGGIFGFVSANAYFPADSFSVTVLANAAPSQPDQLLRLIAVEALGLGRGLAAADRARYVGTYALAMPNGATLPLRVLDEGGRLLAQAEGQRANVLLPLAPHQFGVAFDRELRLTFAVEGDRATRVALRQSAGTVEGPRVP